jgi:hypothetical protein
MDAAISFLILESIKKQPNGRTGKIKMTFANRHQAAYYRILVKGHLEPSWGSWFDGMSIQNLPDGETMLTGPVADQAMLHGLLIKIRDLGLPLISLSRLSAEKRENNTG